MVAQTSHLMDTDPLPEFIIVHSQCNGSNGFFIRIYGGVEGDSVCRVSNRNRHIVQASATPKAMVDNVAQMDKRLNLDVRVLLKRCRYAGMNREGFCNRSFERQPGEERQFNCRLFDILRIQ